MSARAHQLLTLGQSVWLDFIRRGHLLDGGFDRDVREAGVVGVTSNPTIFHCFPRRSMRHLTICLREIPLL